MVSWVEAEGFWKWNDSQVLEVGGRDGSAGSNEALRFYIDNEWLWTDDCEPPCDGCEWAYHEECSKHDEGGNQTHHHGMYSDIHVIMDGWWHCSYGYWGPGCWWHEWETPEPPLPGMYRFIDEPGSDWYQEY